MAVGGVVGVEIPLLWNGDCCFFSLLLFLAVTLARAMHSAQARRELLMRTVCRMPVHYTVWR